MLFLNCHLAGRAIIRYRVTASHGSPAHEGKVHNRLANLAKIKSELPVDSFLPPDDPRTFAEGASRHKAHNP